MQVVHYEWVDALRETARKGVKFEGELDPKECVFGKWYYSDARKHAEEMVPELKPIFAAKLLAGEMPEDIDFVFREIGLLDMDFCPYGSEDIDFCARLKKRGWKIKYIPDAICWHRSESSFSDSYNRSFYNMRNILLLARKHLNPFYFSFVFVPDFVFLTLPLIIIEGLLKRQKKRLKGVIRAIQWNIQDAKKRGLSILNS